VMMVSPYLLGYLQRFPLNISPYNLLYSHIM
jgi:hypothetical protein